MCMRMRGTTLGVADVTVLVLVLVLLFALVYWAVKSGSEW